MTLLQFLRDFQLGTILEAEHGEDNTNIELFTIGLTRPMEVGELPSLAASYLIRSCYRRVSVTRQSHLENLPVGFDIDSGFTYSSLVVGEDDELPPITILVSYTDDLANFAKKHGIGK